MGSGKSVPMPVIAVAIAALVLFVGWYGWKSFQPEQHPRDAATQTKDRELETMAKKCNGDFSKLSPQEQARANELSAGHGSQAIAGIAAH